MPWPALRQEPADRRVLAERREQLDPAVADEHGRRLDALLLDEAAVLELGAEEPRVRRDRLVEVADGDADVMDAAGDHVHAMLTYSARGSAKDAHGADRLGRARLGLDVAEQLVAAPRGRASPSRAAPARRRSSGRRCLSSSRFASSYACVGQPRLLRVAQPLRLLRERVVVGAHRPRRRRLGHAVLEDHRAGDLRHLLEVVRRAVRDRGRRRPARRRGRRAQTFIRSTNSSFVCR